MKRIFLVDTENVNVGALVGASKLSEEDMIILFVTQRTTVHQFTENNIKSLNTKANVLKINVITGTKNSLDFQLVSYLGFVIGEHRGQDNDYYIVSKDKGFLSAINILQNCTNTSIQLIESISILDKDNSLKLNEKSLIDKFVERGFRTKTAIKMTFILLGSNSIMQAQDRFLIEFAGNFNILYRCIDIFEGYYKEKSQINKTA